MSNKPRQGIIATIFQWAVIVGGLSVWSLSVVRLYYFAGSEELIEIAVFALAVMVISSRPIVITTPGMTFSNKRQLSITMSDSLTFLLLVLHGPASAIVLTGLDGFIASRHTIKRWSSNIFTWAMFSLSVFGASQIFGLTLGLKGLRVGAGFGYSFLQLLVPLIAAGGIHFLISSTLLATLLGLRYRTSIVRQWIDNQLWTAVTYVPLTLTALIPYIAAQQFGWINMIAVLPVLALVYFSIWQYNRRVEEKVRQIADMNELNLSLAQALAMAIDAKDNTTPEHVQRVQIYGRGLARVSGLTEMEASAIEAGAMLHDVGKLAIPDYILNKPGKLTPAEFDKVKIHTVVGAEILSQVKFPFPVAPVVRHHHEKWDGTGYPDGLKGENIPIAARVLSIVDCFDAVQEQRQWRNAMTPDEAIKTILTQAGEFYDPRLVALFVANLAEFEGEIARQGLRPEAATGQTDAIAVVTLPSSHDKIMEANREVSLLYEIAQTVGTSLSLEETLDVLLTRISELVPYTTGVVYLERNRMLDAAHAVGPDAAVLKGCQMVPGTGLSGWAFESNEPTRNSDPRLDFAAMQAKVERVYRTSVVVPLAKQDGVFGTLSLYSADLESYSQEHARLAEAIVGMSGDAILNAIKHEEIETTALTDRLTGLPNLRSISHRYEQEAARALATGQNFTLLMMDLDGFKKINDQLGHQVGDRYLCEIGRIIDGQKRDRDFFGRYGGDEFIAILPNTYKSMVYPLMDRIRNLVEGFALPVEGGKSAVAGISMGVAEYGIDGTTMDELMTVADVSMYADKELHYVRAEQQQGESPVVRFPSRSRQRAG